MNAKNLKNNSRTDWKSLESMPDKEIDLSESPELTDNFFKRARRFTTSPDPNAIQLDADVVEWFKTHSRNYQRRINKILRDYIQVKEQ